MASDTSITVTDSQKETVDKLQDYMNEHNLGYVTKGQAVDHAAKAYPQVHGDSNE